ncbi:MAG TPA: nucleotide exchange factor GrpE [Jatrophihabitantaceae bacterium]|nr:nucleotide exchange factor GrpE [Jatrophihabitantaceae bacterium]
MSDLPEIDPDRVVIRDKRRIDPVTGEARRPQPGPQAAAAPDPDATEVADGSAAGEAAPDVDVPSAELVLLQTALAERTADLQRLQAEYANYRKRVDRDRILVRELAVGELLTDLLPLLDGVDLARAHDDLDGPFKAIADQLASVLAKFGLEAFGEPGDPFDPSLHEAVLHNESDDVTEPTATTVMRRGYRHGERLLRPAMVGVSEPGAGTAGQPDLGDSGGTAGTEGS